MHTCLHAIITIERLKATKDILYVDICFLVCFRVFIQANYSHIINLKLLHMTYYESADTLIISKARALQELKNHGCEDLKEFFQDLGNHETYKAQSVLIWLGY